MKIRRIWEGSISDGGPISRPKRSIVVFVLSVLALAILPLLLSGAETVYAGNPAEAPSLSVKGEWSGEFALEQGGTNYYKFTITEAGETTIKFMSYASNLEYSLCDSGLKRIDGQSHISGSEKSPIKASMYEYLSQGTYYLAVTSYNGAGSGSYKLCVYFDSSKATAADGDSYEMPQDIQAGKEVSGIMTYSNKEDWYKLVISDAGIYNYQFSGNYGESCDVYNGKMSKLSSLRWMGSKAVELEPGTYYIRIKASEGAGSPYRLQFTEVSRRKGEILPVTRSANALYVVTKPGINGTVTYYKPIGSPKASVVIPAAVWDDGIRYKVTSISANAFKGNKRLKEITLGKNVVSIGSRAFSGCTNLKGIKLPSGVSTIRSQVFYQCTGLKSITLPADVSSIGRQAFYGCKNLKAVTIKTGKLTASKVGEEVFKGIHPRAVIKLPKNKFNAYKKMLKKKGVGAQAVYKK